MKLLSRIFMLLLPASGLLLAQDWEVGAAAGYGLFRDATVTGPTISGKTGFAPGIAFGGVFGNNNSRLVGGEVRYTYRADDLKVTSGSTKANAKAESHALHYDVLIHTASREAKVRPFFAVGAGIKYFRGTGAEPAFQPLSNLVVLTHANQLEPLLSAGGGVKVRASQKVMLRLDFRDYATPTPDKLLATPRATTIKGWMHDFVFLLGVSSVF